MLETLPDNIGETTSETMSRAVSDRYLSYAIATIVARALPDARDGLKPVHRRILHAMNELHLTPTGAFRKSAKIVGDVMGNYHPHGDSAIYDAMVRLAQPFALRYPLVDGQGNFGNIDGDGAAASRYTEARLPRFSEMLLSGIDEDAVLFRPNYDGTLSEPSVLPAAFPNLLANGSSGIAVGMATNIPPHNLAELIAACELLIDNPDLPDEALFSAIPGPDFPTGGILVDPPEIIAQAYRTGRGSLRIRSKWEVEDLGRGVWQIAVTEIPYGVQKSRLIENLADLVEKKKIPVLADIRDESAEDVRIIIEPRARNVDPSALMTALFKNSDLETRFGVNCNVLTDGKIPKVCSLRELLQIFIAHRRDVLERRCTYRLGKVLARLEIIAGHIIAYLNLDRIIEILRQEDEAKSVMMAEFGLSEIQAEAILNMRLRSLRKLEEAELLQEQAALQAEAARLQEILSSRDRQMLEVRSEISALRAHFGPDIEGCGRRSQISVATADVEVPVEMMVDREPITIALSQMGWIRAIKGHAAIDSDLKYKDGDGPLLSLKAYTTDKVMVFADNGKSYTLPASSLPNGRSFGEALRLMIDLPQESQIAHLSVWQENASWILANSQGEGFRIEAADVLAQTRTGRQLMNLADGSRMSFAMLAEHDHIAVLGENRRLLIFPLSELPSMARGKGVRLQKYRLGGMADIICLPGGRAIHWTSDTVTDGKISALDDWLGHRSGAGKSVPENFPGKLSSITFGAPSSGPTEVMVNVSDSPEAISETSSDSD